MSLHYYYSDVNSQLQDIRGETEQIVLSLEQKQIYYIWQYTR